MPHISLLGRSHKLVEVAPLNQKISMWVILAYYYMMHDMLRESVYGIGITQYTLGFLFANWPPQWKICKHDIMNDTSSQYAGNIIHWVTFYLRLWTHLQQVHFGIIIRRHSQYSKVYTTDNSISLFPWWWDHSRNSVRAWIGCKPTLTQQFSLFRSFTIVILDGWNA